MIFNENLQQMVLAVVEADVPKFPPQNPSCPATSVVLPVLDGAENIFTTDVRDGSGQNPTQDLTQPKAILANPTRPEPFFYGPKQPEEIFLPTRKYFFHKCVQIQSKLTKKMRKNLTRALTRTKIH